MKQNWKRLLSVLLALVLVIGLLPAVTITAKAADFTVTVRRYKDDAYWDTETSKWMSKDGTREVTVYAGQLLYADVQPSGSYQYEWTTTQSAMFYGPTCDMTANNALPHSSGPYSDGKYAAGQNKSSAYTKRFSLKVTDSSDTSNSVKISSVTITPDATGPELQDTLSGLSVLMRPGETSKSIKELLGRAGVVHVNCDYTTVSSPSQSYHGGKITVSTGGTISTSSDSGGLVQDVSYNFATNNCMFHGTVSGRTYNLKVYVLGAKQEGAYSDAIKINFSGLPTDGTADVILYDSNNNEVGYLSGVDCSTGSATVTFINGTNATIAANSSYKAMIRVSSPSSLTGSRAQTTMTLTTGNDPMPSAVNSLTLSPDTLALTVGDTSALTATVGPDTANPTVVWTSSDPSVATVDENGVVTAVGPGTVTITCTATNGTPDPSDDISATCEVTVNAPAPKTFKVYVKKLTGETYTIENLTGETTVAQLKEIIADQIDIPATAQRLIFAGKQLEDAKTLAEYNIVEESTIHLVIRNYTVTWLNYDNSELGTTTVQYGATPSYDGATPEKAEDENYTYTFSGWSDGSNTYAADALPAVSGDVTYTAVFTADPKTPQLTDVTLSPDTLNLEVGDTSALTATVGPDGADPAVVWTSSDPSIATVDENGVVTAVSPGTATITCTATNGTPDPSDDVSATCEVTVKAQGPHVHDGVTFTAWTDSTSLPTTGNYYLTTDVTLSSRWDISVAAQVSRTLNICLNGHTIRRNLSEFIENGQVLYIKGSKVKFNLYDCVGTGQITGGKSLSYGGGIYIESCNQFTMYGGTICGNSVSGNSGGGVYFKAGVFELKGGAIRDNTATAVNGTGGNGGGVYASNGSNAVFRVSGPVQITGNTGNNTDNNVFLQSGKTITIGASLNITETETALIGVTTESKPAAGSPVVFTNSLSGKGTAANFFSDDPAYSVTLTAGGEAQLALPVFVTDVTLSPNTLDLTVGDTSALTATVGPDGADPTVVWTSSDPSVATVDENGVVTAVGTGTAIITCTATNGTPDDTSDDVSATCTVTVTVPVQYIAGYSLSLKGDIAMNFYFDLHEVDPAGATVDFTWDTDKSQQSRFADLSTVTVGENQYYRISVPVNAKEINDEISLTLKNGETVLQTHSFSVADYARRVYANENNEFGSYAALTELQKLCLQMLIYGAKAQLQFNYNTAALADAGLTYTLDDVDASTLPDTTVKDLSAFGLVYFGSSLLLESTLTHRLYFRVEDANLKAATTVSYGTKTLTVKDVTDKTPLGNPEGDYVYVDLADISAKRITSPFTVTFTNGTSTVRMNVNAASYIKQALAGSNETLKTTVTALYGYNQAAVAYFAAKNG